MFWIGMQLHSNIQYKCVSWGLPKFYGSSSNQLGSAYVLYALHWEMYTSHAKLHFCQVIGT